jgi:hypothetical protein
MRPQLQHRQTRATQRFGPRRHSRRRVVRSWGSVAGGVVHNSSGQVMLVRALALRAVESVLLQAPLRDRLFVG